MGWFVTLNEDIDAAQRRDPAARTRSSVAIRSAKLRVVTTSG